MWDKKRWREEGRGREGRGSVTVRGRGGESQNVGVREQEGEMLKDDGRKRVRSCAGDSKCARAE